MVIISADEWEEICNKEKYTHLKRSPVQKVSPTRNSLREQELGSQNNTELSCPVASSFLSRAHTVYTYLWTEKYTENLIRILLQKLLMFLCANAWQTLSHGQWLLKMRLQWPCMMKVLESVTWGYFTLNSNKQTCMMVHTWNLSTWGADARGSWIQGNLGYGVRPCLKTKAKTRAVSVGASGDRRFSSLWGWSYWAQSVKYFLHIYKNLNSIPNTHIKSRCVVYTCNFNAENAHRRALELVGQLVKTSKWALISERPCFKNTKWLGGGCAHL